MTVRITKMGWPLVFAMVLGACPQQGGGAGATKPPESEEDKTLYAIGLQLGRQVQRYNLSPAELGMVQQGLKDSIAGTKPVVELEKYFMKMNDLARARAAVRAEQEKARSKAFLDKAGAEAGVQKTASGLIYKELTAGTGEQPAGTDTVKVHYKGTLVDGTEFDSSYKRNMPATFGLNGVIKCWTEGVAMMKTGGKAQLVCPSDIAYGDMGRPPTIPGGATLVFEVELLEVVKAAPAPTLAPATPTATPPPAQPAK